MNVGESEKQQKYSELIASVKADYQSRSKTEKGIYVTWNEYCNNQINLWSYWQGSLDARILLIGQDWGNFNPEQKELDRIMRENFKRMDVGEKANYFDDVADRMLLATDKHLIRLFAQLGNEYSDIREKNDALFFTNLCLGYRNEGYSGNFKDEWLQRDVKYLTGFDEQLNGKHVCGLLEIIMPNIVICLGRRTYEVTVSALCEENVVLKDFYSLLDEHKNFLDISYRQKNMRFYAMSHPGGMGMANRKSHSDAKNDSKTGAELQSEDWKEIGKYEEAQRWKDL